MTQTISCEGAPRDQGSSQGSAYRHVIRDWASRVGVDARRKFLSSIRPLAAGPVLGTGVGREVLRHHPHMAERMDGIARGADLPLSSLMEMVMVSGNHAACSGTAASDADAHVALLSADVGGGLARALPAHAAPGCAFVLRQSAPEIGFRSVEVTLPWQASCVAGVNERGLAIAIAPEPACQPPYSFDPPAILLVQDCLQRFADLESALEWCAGRPAAGGVTIAVADETGASAAAVLSPDGNRVLRAASDQESIVCGGSAESAAELRKELEAGGHALDVLQGRDIAGVVSLDARARSLSVRWAGADADVIARVPAGDGTPPETA